ncbi:hypothetical protein C0Q70_07793 [Pomacea canaliculata]|uniref:PPC domain-containing protein n=2 Tax=Pomacea canaliculata TaxID=400727 RepID=A0A2T7PG61_POMCA|nr:hypothetical protein C0Q70_07793 [Pomacea canaliculata]
MPLRLKPGQELKTTLMHYVQDQKLKAAFIVTCVGSVLRATLRMANSKTITTFEGPFEIVSLVGTLSGGEGHLHISLSDKNGKVIGGHVIGDLDIYTTAEIVLGECENTSFLREYDSETGYDELVVYHDEKATA